MHLWGVEGDGPAVSEELVGDAVLEDEAAAAAAAAAAAVGRCIRGALPLRERRRRCDRRAVASL